MANWHKWLEDEDSPVFVRIKREPTGEDAEARVDLKRYKQKLRVEKLREWDIVEK